MNYISLTRVCSIQLPVLFNQQCTVLGLLRPLQVAGKKTDAKYSLPVPPKKVSSSYNLYMKEELVKQRKATPKKPYQDVFKKVVKSWLNTSDAQKQVYEKRLKKTSKVYSEEYQEYIKQLTEVRDELIMRGKSQQGEIKSILSKANKEKSILYNKPKHPGNAFADYRGTLSPGKDQSYKEFMSSAALKWQTLNLNEKNKIMKEQEAKRGKYNEELTIWEEKMIKLKEHDLVRKHKQ